MSTLHCIFRLLIHGQLLMAASAASYVAVAGILVNEVPVPLVWLVAAFFGTLGIYLLDSVRSADREDAISQSVRAGLFRANRGWAILSGLLSLGVGGLAVVWAQVSFEAWVVLILLGVLGLAYLLPVLPVSGRRLTLKDLSLVKPLLISLAWLVGALLVARESMPASPPTSALLDSMLFGLATGPTLLLDSLWLDRRDRAADVAFGHPTIASILSVRGFLLIRIVLWGLPCLVLVLDSGFLIPVLGLLGGSLVLVCLEPDRMGFESTRVVAASLWRFTLLLVVLCWMG
ncbi:MAG: hypothetical protein CBC35_12340 [Planctomycetes bacterium TMED75]|nr:hypothetical protein [Planctomycetaceae bacterium]OUU90075.1 MAG: hypothetical protein CBC35_12340 [Planctomycetes bacterium TMED75]